MKRLLLVPVLLLLVATRSFGQSAPREEQVTFTNGGVTLAGTVLVPAGAGPFPAFVMITGSGAQNRDEELFGFKPFKVIAEHMAQHGIATLRYDDRGVGGSSGSIAQATTSDFADDALAGLAMLAKRADINPKRLGVVGHSEGAIAAAIAAAKSKDVAFIVMIAGTAVRGREVLKQQNADLLRASGADPAIVDRAIAAHARVMEAVATGAPVDKQREAVRDLMHAQLEAAPAAQRAAIGDIDEFIAKTVDTQVASLNFPWMKFFVGYDPATALAQVTCPVLAIFGSVDMQVPPAMNRPPLEKALAKNPAVTVKQYEGANHLFQAAKTGNPSEYATLEKQFVAGFLDDITAWILARK
jgi:pimeloyl-ACP methyl ester carboxylesterase